MMMPSRSTLILVATAAAWAPASAGAQSPAADSAGEHPGSGRHGVEVWAGFARHSPRLGVLGNAPDRNLALAAVRWTRRVRERPGLALDYTADFIPVALLSPADTGATAPRPGAPDCGPQQACALAALGGPFRAGSAYGAGASPLGLTATFRPRRRLQPTLGVTGGFLWFDRREPTAQAARFNFTAAAEAGVRLAATSGAGVALTYRFHHLSNAGTARDNPAVASHVVSVGVRWPSRR